MMDEMKKVQQTTDSIDNNEKKASGKKKKIISTAVAGVLSVALLGTATYAWFVLNNRPTVDALTMSAGTSGSLQVALKPASGTPSDSDYSSSIVIGDVSDDFCLRPVTSPDGVNFYQPIYNSEGVATSVDTTPMVLTSSGADTAVINNNEEDGGWIVKKQFYIRNKVADATDVDTSVSLLAPSDSTQGTLVTDTTSGGTASQAVRISFKVEYTAPAGVDVSGCTASGTTVMYEPNASVNDLSTAVKLGGVTYYSGLTYISQKRTGSSGSYAYKFKNASGVMAAADTYDSVYSPTLFTIPNNTNVLVTMYVWVEGTDADCTNQGASSIEADAIAAKLQFVATDDM